jgi:tetratricopeptide (TPR) repeat protein
MKLTILVATSLMLASTGAFADDAKAAAKQHVASARVLHAQQRFTEAVAALEAAYTLDPKPSLLFALGQLHVQLGRCERAVVFYRRFLATRPKREDAAVAREAMTACKTVSPIRVTTSPRAIAPPLPEPLPAVPRAPETPPQALALPVRTTRDSHRTARGVGLGLVVAGVGAAAGSLMLYRAAIDDRDRADAAATYEDYERLIDRAGTRYTGSVVAGAIGVAAITAGVIVFAIRRRDTVHTVRVTPGGGGASVRWSARF